MRHAPLLVGLLLAACAAPPTDAPEPPESTPTPAPAATPAPERVEIAVQVTLDGVPAPGVTLSQGGLPARWTTDETGAAQVTLDRTLDGEHWIIASHPEARQTAAELRDDANLSETVVLELTRFVADDNPQYTFRHPGTPDQRESTAFCAHCHVTINEDWFASPHRTSASNPVVQDLYSGVRSDIEEEGPCVEAGGLWQAGLAPGTGELVGRCYVGDGALPALNEHCGTDTPCDESATAFGGCADCHAPGIDGQLGGRDLLRAEGLAYDFGVHCDVCHRVESLDPDGEPGVAGALQLVRPSEAASFGQDWFPLVFGPYDDVPSGVMGAVAREHFGEAAFCGGCHEQAQEVLVPGELADLSRWPDGRLPIHTTFTEWQASPLAESAPCQACHMPPDPEVTNSADLQLLGLEPGMVQGWIRPPGSVRKHAWIGPRQPESGMLQQAAALFVDKEVSEGELIARVTVRNAGAGHAIPTGEPMRSMVLRVAAACDDQPLDAIGGDVVPGFGGALATQDDSGDWSVWPGAEVGERIRVVRREGWIDYPGFGRFGDGSFDAEAKGLPTDEFVADVEITGVDGDVVTLAAPLPPGDVAYRVRASGLPSDGDESSGAAGAPGFGFARVTAAADGRTMVPHFLAVDIASDNRLMPQQEWTSTHRFAAPCDEPTVQAVLVHRAWPLELARERGWDSRESVMVEVER